MMFQGSWIAREPDLDQGASRPDMVDVPMRSLGFSGVTPDSRGQASRTESAADIDVKTMFQSEDA